MYFGLHFLAKAMAAASGLILEGEAPSFSLGTVLASCDAVFALGILFGSEGVSSSFPLSLCPFLFFSPFPS